MTYYGECQHLCECCEAVVNGFPIATCLYCDRTLCGACQNYCNDCGDMRCIECSCNPKLTCNCACETKCAFCNGLGYVDGVEINIECPHGCKESK